MKDQQISDLFQQCLHTATDNEKVILHQLLLGFKEKIKEEGSYIGRLLRMKRILTETECEISIPVSELVHNSLQIVHGGITATILDSSMGSIANAVCPPSSSAVTSNLNIHYIAPGKGDFLNAKAKLLHKGSKTLIVEGEVEIIDSNTDTVKKIAHATGTFFILHPPTENKS
ncbi:uncharacterized protein (TIGR00369 family) [Oikeobacillus pervagus]|uniref:Medium/long-chain acyl-CoA thioesterase YigI n=1 Tax=Oikeobacillus pervagus TaxID=1325931 RepID=A0AAJ1T4S3_9BACI|nr:PaaI family thioesterase [Oikeobacillus pervagus]MDQ0215211.1 uncharacterized protein (TIGR00369 family) [Oikeobacillus pervagus]